MPTKREHQLREYNTENINLVEDQPKLLTQVLARHFTMDQIKLIYVAMGSVCPYCHDQFKPCNCWNSE